MLGAAPVCGARGRESSASRCRGKSVRGGGGRCARGKACNGREQRSMARCARAWEQRRRESAQGLLPAGGGAAPAHIIGTDI